MLNLRLLAAKFLAQVKAVGFLCAVDRAVKQVLKQGMRRLNPVQDDFDIRYGTDTGGFVNLWKYRIESPNAKYGVSYGSSSEQHIEVLLSPLPRTASFVDLGCGKGRPLLVAAAMGFKTVIGVEFVRELVEIAKENLRKTRTNAMVVCADAACYEFPAGPLVVYLYDPFNATVVSSVAQKLRLRKGELWVVYVNPEHGGLFESWMERMSLTPIQAQLFSPESVSIWHKVFPNDPEESSE
jgi:SAM-dependent methyltransferase